MMTSLAHGAGPLIRKLERLIRLNDDERQALDQLPLRIATFEPGHEITRQGDRPQHCVAVLEGFCSVSKIVGEGGRSIVSFHIPGDIPDLQSLHVAEMDVSLTALTKTRVLLIQHEDARRLCAQSAAITHAFWRETLIAGAIAKEWVVNLGQRDALARVAHLFCETIARLEVVGLADDRRCHFPVTQEQLGEAMGLSTIHINRTLQELRSRGLISWERGDLEALRWEDLKAVGDFDPGYLSLAPDWVVLR
ncbi:Crp/Fnr family transcriptional regulator [Terrihabitans rhizophilus]|uniref:Crp/Fnr family transcriptional regulator n=1 Tax=Terrihabitans rhizophilus TaxID=3092662 RepID=A0ABU4RW82_9HYPH|nr:Crp/Fnr family transcriptional regulator [Terrihabitans sp. PJ23]MDX6807136.1 Crp/Fnr family transcriptional regulator [Terrihabitans sp. PJ23]